MLSRHENYGMCGVHHSIRKPGARSTVYHLHMMGAGSYFLAQHFPMGGKDVLYFSNADQNTEQTSPTHLAGPNGDERRFGLLEYQLP